MQEEFYAIAFRKKMYNSVEDLQTDVDLWLEYYNNERSHSGRHCYGKTPMQTCSDPIPLAKEKMINEHFFLHILLILRGLLNALVKKGDGGTYGTAWSGNERL